MLPASPTNRTDRTDRTDRTNLLNLLHPSGGGRSPARAVPHVPGALVHSKCQNMDRDSWRRFPDLG